MKIISLILVRNEEKPFLLIRAVELDHRRLAAKILVNKTGILSIRDICVINILNYCMFASYSEFSIHGFYTCFNRFK